MPAKRKKTPASDGNKRRRVSDKGGKQKKKGKKKGGAEDEVEEVCGTDFVFVFLSYYYCVTTRLQFHIMTNNCIVDPLMCSRNRIDVTRIGGALGSDAQGKGRPLERSRKVRL